MRPGQPALPRGPHRLSREEVARSQRERLLDAMTRVLAESGFEGVTIASLATAARVSRATFYEHFADKESCLLAAYDHFAARIAASLPTDSPPDGDWEAFVDRSIREYLAAFQSDPVASRAFLVRMDEAGPVARARRRQGVHAFAALLEARYAAVRENVPSLAPLRAGVLLTYAFGVRELIREQLEDRPQGDLLDLAPVLVLTLVTLVRGAASTA